MADMKTVKASARKINQAPRKIGLVASLVRGRSVADALTILEYTPKRAAAPLRKVIASAKANATNTHRLDEKTLTIATLTVAPGARLKRFRAGARGMAKPYQKQSSHIFVTVQGEAKKPAATRKSKEEEK